MNVIDLKQRLLAEAKARMEVGDFEGAVPILEKVTRFARGDDAAIKFAHVNLAAHFYEEGDPRCVDHFHAALAIDPDDHRVRYCLGHAHLDADQFVEAVHAFESALKARPGDAEYLRSLGASLAAGGKLREAVVPLRAAARVCPDEPHVLQDLAQVLAALGQHDEALRHIRRAVALAPDEPFFTEVLEELEHLRDVERLARPAKRKRR